MLVTNLSQERIHLPKGTIIAHVRPIKFQVGQNLLTLRENERSLVLEVAQEPPRGQQDSVKTVIVASVDLQHTSEELHDRARAIRGNQATM